MKSGIETVVTEIARATKERGSARALYASQPAAGFPAPGDDQVERVLDINDLVVQHPEATFYVRVAGDSMVGAGIFPNDVLVVDRAIEATHGVIVVAAVNGELVVKQLWQQAGRYELHSANQAYSAIVLGDDEEAFIWGVVVGSVRQFR